MQDGLKEKYNIFKGLVGVFDSKLASAIIVTLLITIFFLFLDNRSLHKTIDENKDKMYQMVIDEVKKQVTPVISSQKQTSQVVDTIRQNINGALIDLKKESNKKK